MQANIASAVPRIPDAPQAGALSRARREEPQARSRWRERRRMTDVRVFALSLSCPLSCSSRENRAYKLTFCHFTSRLADVLRIQGSCESQDRRFERLGQREIAHRVRSKRSNPIN